MSQQQQSRAYTRPKGDPALTTYTGQVMLVAEPEIGKNGKERPRKIMISDNPGQYQGKTFRIWAWKDDFGVLEVGEWVTVHYEVEPSLDPTRRGANAISVVETAEQGAGSGGGEPQSAVGEVASNAGETPAPSPGSPPPESWADTKDSVSKDDYWAHREATDQERTLEIECAWAIKAVLDIENYTSAQLMDPKVQDAIVTAAIQLVILKRQAASDLGRG